MGDITKETFLEHFSKQRANIEATLDLSDSVEKTKLAVHFESLLESCHKLHESISKATRCLPAYEVRIALQSLTAIEKAIHEKRDKLLPKKKFKFSNIKKETKAPPVTKTSNHPAVSDGLADALLSSQSEIGFKNVTGETLHLPPSDIKQSDVVLSKLSRCVVTLYGTPNTVHIDKLEGCKIFTGPVTTTVFIEDCSNCTFVVACQQLRTHTTTHSDFYIHVTSRCVIESCENLRFAPYNYSYPNIGDDFDEAGLDSRQNNWNDIDDFNWLAKDKASPHWRILPESERVKCWDI